jgi:hypothetical protein
LLFNFTAGFATMSEINFVPLEDDVAVRTVAESGAAFSIPPFLLGRG